MFNMAMLNRTAAALMHTFNAHAATDITGFGILGHARNLAQQQRSDVAFGTSSETSGGLLICLPREQAARFCAEMKSSRLGQVGVAGLEGGAGEGQQAWIIGIVEKGNRCARIIDKPRIIEVPPRGSVSGAQEGSNNNTNNTGAPSPTETQGPALT
ncbi:hypothetical protein SKAU_G00160220 [Synaphobranchus kaupii]|uniref:selenide, water dikinase n=1 Tax=Synaphobranchus kaupii TaxID=118154 RepID=A0A9Q1FID0_SYNKA|nr:hypothetical protein SKAU_G00160220 [Synaphobranchus kaupii]